MSTLERLKEQAEKIAEKATVTPSSEDAGLDGLAQNVLIPIEVFRHGKVIRVYISIPGYVIDNPNLLMAVIDELDQIYDGVASFQRKNNFNNNNSYNGGNKGNYNGGGGYNNSYNNKRNWR